MCKAPPSTSTTLTLPSLEGPSGVFDVPTEKCRELYESRGHGGSVTAKLRAIPLSPSLPTVATTTTSTTNATTTLPPPFPASTRRIDIPISSSARAGSTGQVQFQAPLTPSPSPTGAPLRGATIASTLTRGPPISIPASHNGMGTMMPTPPSTPPYGILGTDSPTMPLPATCPLLAQLFPNNLTEAVPLAKSVSVQSFQPDGSSVQWDGFVLKTPPPTAPMPRVHRRSSTASSASSSSSSLASPTGRSAFKGARAAQAAMASAAAASAVGGKTTKTLYMSAQGAFKQYDRVRETIVALLDLASEHLECDSLVMVLDRGMGGGAISGGVTLDSRLGTISSGASENTGVGAGGSNQYSRQEFGELLHSLMYVGGSVVTRPPFPVDPRFVLVGIEV